jgi:hypothetical protein
MLSPTNCIKDRLASYYFLDDKQSLDQAIKVYKKKKEIVDLKEIKRWSKKKLFRKI